MCYSFLRTRGWGSTVSCFNLARYAATAGFSKKISKVFDITQNININFLIYLKYIKRRSRYKNIIINHMSKYRTKSNVRN